MSGRRTEDARADLLLALQLVAHRDGRVSGAWCWCGTDRRLPTHSAACLAAQAAIANAEPGPTGGSRETT